MPHPKNSTYEIASIGSGIDMLIEPLTGKILGHRDRIGREFLIPLLPDNGDGITPAEQVEAIGWKDNALYGPIGQIDSLLPAWTYPGLGPTFDVAVEKLPVAQHLVFGSAAVAPTGGIAITDAVTLAAHFRPLNGEFDASNNHLGNTGPTVINSEPQKYRQTFTESPNHVFDADGLRLQATIDGGAGSFGTTARGALTTGASVGLNVNDLGGNTTTALSDLGLSDVDMTNVQVGDLCTNGERGLALVKAKGTGTVTLEAIGGGGPRTGYKANWHITFTQFQAARLAAGLTTNTTDVLTFTGEIPARVVVGMQVLYCGKSTNESPRSSHVRRILSIAGDRLSCTLDGPAVFSSSLAANDWVIFLPALSSGQIAAKRATGAHMPGQNVYAVEIEFTGPSLAHYANANTVFTKAQVESAYTAAPSTPWGMWPAFWLFPWRPGEDGNGLEIVEGARDFVANYNEIDIYEGFVHVNRGQSVYSSNLHDQPYTRRRSMANSATASRIPGATWQTLAATNEQLSANSNYLNLPSSILSGTRRKVSIIQVRGKVLCYLDGIPVAESDWSADTDYPFQLICNVACGSLTGGNVANLFFPQSDAQATGQWIRIHSIKTWEA